MSVDKKTKTVISGAILKDIHAFEQQVRAVLASTGTTSIFYYNLEIQYRDENNRVISNLCGSGEKKENPITLVISQRNTKHKKEGDPDTWRLTKKSREALQL